MEWVLGLILSATIGSKASAKIASALGKQKRQIVRLRTLPVDVAISVTHPSVATVVTNIQVVQSLNVARAFRRVSVISVGASMLVIYGPIKDVSST